MCRYQYKKSGTKRSGKYDTIKETNKVPIISPNEMEIWESKNSEWFSKGSLGKHCVNKNSIRK